MRQFLATESGSAGLLLAATVIALVWANSPLASSYVSFWATELSVTLGDWSLALDLRHWVDEGLMALFFFVIGLEVRRELAMGELTERRRIAVPVIGGIGGMLIPALIFLLINPSGEAANGWGIVIATDTAFVLGALALVGPKFSTQLRVFLLTLAIVDDIVAISIIGVVYADALNPVALAVCGACLAVIALLPRLGIWQGGAYLFVGLILIVAAIESGLHPTLAGMLAGLLVVAHPPTRGDVERADRKTRAFRQSPLPDVARSAHRSVQQALSPNERLQTMLHPLASYVIVPLFALANAGVDLRGGILAEALSSPVTWGVVAGLVIGKTTGITAGVFATVRSGLGEIPRGVGGGQMVGGAALSGIGFTVSLLIAGLAFEDPVLQDQAVVGIMIAAVLATGLGWLTFKLAAALRGETEAGLPRKLDQPVDPERDHIRGPVDAPLTLVEYADFECPFCGKSTGMIEELRAELGDRLRYVYRHLALIEVHPHSELAAEAAEAAASQGRFWEMHDLLFEHQGELDIEDLIGYAGHLDLDVDQFVTEVEEGRNAWRIQEDAVSADASGAHGTPTFFIGGIRHIGAYDARTLAGELLASA
ncbi:MAG: Na+/H+ antiporter NhaA [Thermoleophilia bacterium]|nr:Na+/H+ antiporter NhaA [Thermoleophilia bacterium]